MKNQKGYTHWVIIILISALAIGLVGIGWYYAENKDKIKKNINVNQQTKDCEQQGGYILPGADGLEFKCITPYSDAGKICTSSDECEGSCVTNILSNLGIKGECDDSTYNGGCYTAIEKDKLYCTMGGDITFDCSEERWMGPCDDYAKKTLGIADYLDHNIRITGTFDKENSRFTDVIWENGSLDNLNISYSDSLSEEAYDGLIDGNRIAVYGSIVKIEDDYAILFSNSLIDEFPDSLKCNNSFGCFVKNIDCSTFKSSLPFGHAEAECIDEECKCKWRNVDTL